MRLPIESIFISPSRQRQDLGSLEELAASLQQVGQLVPILVRPGAVGTWILVAGERRLTALRQLGAAEILAVALPLDGDTAAEVAEFEENAKRKDLTWQEEIRAIARYHHLMCEQKADWSYADTGQQLSLSESAISKRCTVASRMETMPSLAACTSWGAAYNIIQRNIDRAFDAQLDLLDAIEDEVTAPPTFAAAPDLPLDLDAGILEEPGAETGLEVVPQSPPLIVVGPPPRVLQENFLTWAASYSGPSFNFIHCDFPYGVGMDTAPLQHTSQDHARYADTEVIYWDLFRALFVHHREKLISPSAHIMFWLSPNQLGPTMKKLFYLEGVVVDPWPLIWHKSDGKGLLPDPARGTRHTYEMALHIRVGDRKIVRPVAASFSHPLNKAEAVHLSEKPQPVLEHFLRLYIDGSTRMLDPTCGSGNALAVAESLGASTVFGLDIGDISDAERNLAKASRARRQSGDAIAPAFLAQRRGGGGEAPSLL